MSNETNAKLEEIKEFLLTSEGADKSEVIRDILAKMPYLQGYSADEISLVWDEEITDLDTFAHDFWQEVMEKVANVIQSFK